MADPREAESEARDLLVSLGLCDDEDRHSIELAQRRIAARAKVREGYTELYPRLREEFAEDETPRASSPTGVEYPDPMTDRPRGQEAVLRILEDRQFAGKYWTVTMMVEEMRERDWLPGSETTAAAHNAVRAALSRAESHPRIRKGYGRNGHVVYYFQHDDVPSPEFFGPPRRGGRFVTDLGGGL